MECKGLTVTTTIKGIVRPTKKIFFCGRLKNILVWSKSVFQLFDGKEPLKDSSPKNKKCSMIYSPSSHRWWSMECFLWWMDVLFWASKSQPPFTAIIKLGRARTFFYITRLYSSERRKSYTPRMAWGWVKYGVIFIFGWTVPLSIKGNKYQAWSYNK